MNDVSEVRVTTRRAAEIAGMGYEGLRSCLKRGLLKHTGLLLPTARRGDPVPELDAKRWSWKEFSLADLCCFRLAKILMDAGLSFEQASSIASADDLWQFFWGNDFIRGSVAIRFMVVTQAGWPAECLYSRSAFIDDLNNGVLAVNAGHVLVDLVAIRNAVTEALKGN